jgi:Tol biopolymer transport system component
MPRTSDGTRSFPARLCAALLLASALPASAAQIDMLTKVFAVRRVSDTASGESEAKAISADGRFVVFSSTAANLVPGQIDENNVADLFLRDRITGTTALVSHVAASAVTTGDLESDSGVISADGRYVAFVSWARNLVAGQVDPQIQPDVFLFDRATSAVTLVSRSAASARTAGDYYSDRPALSADGRYLAFHSNATNLVPLQSGKESNVFLWDRRSGRTTLVSHAAGSATRAAGRAAGYYPSPSISADGQWIAYASSGRDLIPGQTGEDFNNVFLFDRSTGRNFLVSRANGSATTGAGGDSPVLSANGESVAFESAAPNLVPGQTMGADGDASGCIFVFHRPMGQMRLVSHAASSPNQMGNSDSGGVRISADGAWVAFVSRATDLLTAQVGGDIFGYNVFLWERASGNVRLLSHPPGSPTSSAGGINVLDGLSADGRRILISGEGYIADPREPRSESEVFLVDRSGQAIMVSSPGGSGQSGGNGESGPAVLSADGNWIAFTSEATDLEPDLKDLNGRRDVFLFGRATGDLEAVSRRDPGLPLRATGGSAGNLSADGRYAVFVSGSPDVAPRVRDLNNDEDVYLYDGTAKTLTLVSHSTAGALQTANGGSNSPQLSADGRFVLYLSQATDLVPGQVHDSSLPDLFLYDRTTGQTTLVSRSATSPATGVGVSFWKAISADGSSIVFTSASRDLVPGQGSTRFQDNVFLYDRSTGAMTLLSHAHSSATQPADDLSYVEAISADGRYVVLGSFASDLLADTPPGVEDLFTGALYLYDKVTRALTLITRPSSPGGQIQGGGDARISADGRWIAFISYSGDLVPGQVDPDEHGNSLDVFLWDRNTRTMRLVSHSPDNPLLSGGVGSGLAMSADGRFIAFSGGGDLVAGYRGSPNIGHVVLYDRTTAVNRLVSSANGSVEPNNSTHPEMSADGRFIVFVSDALRLSAEPIRTLTKNVFLFDRTTGKTTLASRSPLPPFNSGNDRSGDTSPSSDSFGNLSVAANGAVLFESLASNLAAGDYNFNQDVFLYVP